MSAYISWYSKLARAFNPACLLYQLSIFLYIVLSCIMLPHMYPIHSIIGEYIPSGQGGKLTVFVIQVDEQNITSTIVTIETSRIVTKMHTILHSIYE